MKRLLPILIFISTFCQAQNYQCLQGGAKHYFINGNGYLREIAIDSATTNGDTTIYYPFHTPRGAYDPAYMPVLDPNGGSWLGKKVLQLTDGTFIFDSYWNDSVIIKTQGKVGDSWTFYADTSNLYYTATIVATDTMTVLSMLDSVKIIVVTAHDPSGIVTTDPVDSFQIILSKNNGFVQVFDLYTFPYHKPDSVYRSGLDFYLDRSTLDYTVVNGPGGNAPNTSISIFNLTNMVIPNDQQLYNWNVGDIIESGHGYGMTVFFQFYSDIISTTVISKAISGDDINYTLSGTHYSCTHGEPCVLINNAGNYSFSDSHYTILNSSFVPEELNSNYLFYYPEDSSNCLLSPKYAVVPQYYNPTASLDFTDEYTIYKLGIGETVFSYFDDEPLTETDDMIYTFINGVSCGGTLHDTISSVKNIKPPNNSVIIFPNPATTSLTISSTDKITSISITNLIGQTVYSNNYHNEEVQVDVSGIPAGMYLVRINGTEVRKFVKE